MNDDPSSGQNVSTPSIQVQYPASSSDWEEQRGHIQQLYTMEDQPLSFVISEMRRLHNFEATYARTAPSWRPMLIQAKGAAIQEKDKCLEARQERQG